MILETINVGPMAVNCYLLAEKEGSKAVIIDPGDQARKVSQVLQNYNLEPAFIINTHGHYDHIGADDKFGVPVYIHKGDAEFLKNAELNLSAFFASAYNVKSEIRLLEDNEIIRLGAIELKVLHIPGHTPGGIALLMLKPNKNIAFTGDTLFCQGIGRSDLSGGDERLLVKSIREKLLVLPDDTVIYPGHGPSSTIGEEKAGNPFLE